MKREESEQAPGRRKQGIAPSEWDDDFSDEDKDRKPHDQVEVDSSKSDGGDDNFFDLPVGTPQTLIDDNNLGKLPESPLSNVDIMILERTSATLNVNGRYWQCVVIDSVLRSAGHQEVLREMLEIAHHDYRMRSADSQLRMAETWDALEGDLIQTQPFTEEHAEEYDPQQAFLDNRDYQRDSLEYACQVFAIEIMVIDKYINSFTTLLILIAPSECRAGRYPKGFKSGNDQQ